MKLRTFKLGGIHPPENKITKTEAIQELELPKEVRILLSQHIGAPATPVVKKGDKVKVGTLIGAGSSFISANIHSSVSGTVVKIDDISDVTGYKRTAVIIQVEGDEWEESIDRRPDILRDIKLEPQEIVERINKAGIVGKGGAAFPTQVKYTIPKTGQTVDALIINGVECEPYLTADHRVMVERAEEIIVGIRIMMKALNVERAFVGIEANKMDAVEVLNKASSEYENIHITPLKVQYPQGAEKQLIQAVLDREVPSGKLPLDAGCVVNNVGTALAIYEAVQKNKPFIDRVVTTTGKGLTSPGNFKVRVGTSFTELINKAGGLPENSGKVIAGGPMMGKAVTSIDIPVTKGTSGILVLNKEDSHRKKTYTCIRCGKCVGVCPMGLQPYLLEMYSRKDSFDNAESNHALDCIECGSCQFICPSARPLLDYIRYGKQNILRIRRGRK
ncbi:electron transport complex subunit RsxC [Spirochaeta cellobiosiphila]|uniref:electron transport complex subunit RsxC n=1 Tax=Spirochaeta cellobiosiphila TaxID=504483 RepID=UPI00040A5A87|nr:electron transport complex subunit RsxC [Spirochaeta cellobiosiphila]